MMARIDELRLMTKVARMYYEDGLNQPEIAERLDLSQATISRLLKRAQREQIVRVTIGVPVGAYLGLEQALHAKYGVKEVIVVDSVEDDDDQIARDIGSAAAYYLENRVAPGEVIGISSASPILAATADALQPLSRSTGALVIQLIGGISKPIATADSMQLTRRVAELLRGEPLLLPAPSVVGSAEARAVLLEDESIRGTIATFARTTLAFVEIEAVEPSKSRLSTDSRSVLAEVGELRRRGAVGSICLRFFDESGVPMSSNLDDRVIGITLQQLKEVERVVGVGGGRRRLAAIRGALEGAWINVLITDRFIAERLVVAEDVDDRFLNLREGDLGDLQ
jgi:DNA-binding transcriptional regulator LsrR (DeoR family)